MPTLPIYLDHNATTPCDPRVIEAMLPFFTTHFGNAASRSHQYGWQAAEAVDVGRSQVARLIGAESKEIIFTSGATEGCNLALKGVFEMYAGKGNHIITCATEHKAVLDTCKQLEKRGAEVTYLPVDMQGNIDINSLEECIRPDTILIALMYANNETGLVHPVKQIGALAKKHDILFFCDAAQAAGKIPVNVKLDNIDLLSMSAHKLYGPKGAGALYVRRRDPRVTLIPQIDGGGHEKGLRSGTLNVPGIVGFGKACELAVHEMASEAIRLAALRDRLERGLLKLDEALVNGHRENRLPHTTSISFRDLRGEALVGAVSRTIAISSGSACTSALPEPSHVLKAMGLSHELAYSAIRFGLGRFTKSEEIDQAVDQVTKVVEQLKASLQF